MWFQAFSNQQTTAWFGALGQFQLLMKIGQKITLINQASAVRPKPKKKKEEEKMDRLHRLSSSSPLWPALQLRHLLPCSSQDSDGASTRCRAPSPGACYVPV